MNWQTLPGSSPLVSAQVPFARESDARRLPVPLRIHRMLEQNFTSWNNRLRNQRRRRFRKDCTRARRKAANRRRRSSMPKIEHLGSASRKWPDSRQRCGARPRKTLVHLALAIARRILHRELTVDPEALPGLVKAALAKIDIARDLPRAHPPGARGCDRRTVWRRSGLPQQIEVVADPSLEQGSVIFETGRGSLDASVDTQLAEIERGFADLME